MTIETERLLLRPVTADDAQDIFEYSSEPDVGSNAGWKPHETTEETIKIMNEIFIGQQNIFGIILKAENKLIGTIGLIDDPKRENNNVKMLGYAIGTKYWNTGYMTEAAAAVTNYGFKTLNLDLISAYCYPHNKRSQNVLKKLGFKYEGTLSLCEKSYIGTVYDDECYALKNTYKN